MPSQALAVEWGPKNIIIMIADGCGYNHVEATSLYLHGESRSLLYHEFPIQYGMSTYMTEGRYNPESAWGNFNHVKAGYADSAATATAMATRGGVLSGTGSLPVRQPSPPSRLAACSTSAVVLD